MSMSTQKLLLTTRRFNTMMRRMSTSTTSPPPPAATTTTTPKPSLAARGTSLFQRFSSFLVGAGLSALVSQYYIYDEIHSGNQLILKRQSEMEQRIAALEQKSSNKKK